MLINKAVIDGVARVQHGQRVELSHTLLAAFVAILDEAALDPATQGRDPGPAGEATLAELFEVADIDAIHQVRNGIQTALAHAFGDRLLACYESLRLSAYQVVHADMAKRALRAWCWVIWRRWMPRRPIPWCARTVRGRRQHDRHPGCTPGGQQPSAAVPRRALADFEGKWAHDGLVLDNWLRLVGAKPAKDVLDDVKQAMAHRPSASATRTGCGRSSAASP